MTVPTVRLLDPDLRRSVLVNQADGSPVLCTAQVFPSESTPGRFRFGFSLLVEGPEIEAVTGVPRVLLILDPPFRLESN